MKKLLGVFSVVLSFVACTSLHASEIPADTSRMSAAPPASDFLVEGNFVVSSAATGNGLMFGPTLGINLTARDTVGLRPLISLGNASNYMLTGFYRLYFSENKTRFYFEPGGTLSRADATLGPISASFVLGCVYNFTRGLMIGAQAGVDAHGDSSGNSNSVLVGYLNLSPKASLTVGVTF